MTQKFVFIDIDGTLFDSDYGIPTSAIKAIRQARNKQHKVFICTGRPYKEVDEQFRDIGFDGYIYACGGLVEVEEQRIYQSTMPIPQIKAIKQLLDKNNISYALEGIDASYFGKDAYERFYSMYYKDMQDDAKVKAQMQKVNFIPCTREEEIDFSQIIKLSIYTKDENVHTVMKQIDDLHVVLHSLDFNGYINYELNVLIFAKPVALMWCYNITMLIKHKPLASVIV